MQDKLYVLYSVCDSVLSGQVEDVYLQHGDVLVEHGEGECRGLPSLGVD